MNTWHYQMTFVASLFMARCTQSEQLLYLVSKVLPCDLHEADSALPGGLHGGPVQHLAVGDVVEGLLRLEREPPPLLLLEPLEVVPAGQDGRGGAGVPDAAAGPDDGAADGPEGGLDLERMTTVCNCNPCTSLVRIKKSKSTFKNNSK